MPRTLPAALAALLASGSWRQHPALTVVLRDGSVLRYSTALVEAGGVTFSPKLRPEGVEARHLSLTPDDDSQQFSVENVSRVVGPAVAAEANLFDGATATSGTLFVDEAAGATYYDECVPGELVASAVTDPGAEFTLVDEVYAAEVTGVTISEAFPFRDAPPPEERPDPDDLLPRPDPDEFAGRQFRGRYRLPFTTV